MEDDLKLTSEDDSGSPEEGSEHESGIVDGDQAGGTEKNVSDEEINEPDYKRLFEETNKRLENMESLMGRQAQEMGELRKGKIEKPAEEEQINYDEYFDEDSKKAIGSLVESEVERRLRVEKERRDEEALRSQFSELAGEYDISQDNLQDLAMYATSKGVSLKKAAEHLAKIGVMMKKGNGQDRQVADPTKGPRGSHKVVGKGDKVSGSITDESLEEWAARSPEERQRILEEKTENLSV